MATSTVARSKLAGNMELGATLKELKVVLDDLKEKAKRVQTKGVKEYVDKACTLLTEAMTQARAPARQSGVQTSTGSSDIGRSKRL